MNDTRDSKVEDVTVTTSEPESGFVGINMGHNREEGELFCDYRCRQWWIKRLIKFHLRGKSIWMGSMGQKVGSF